MRQDKEFFSRYFCFLDSFVRFSLFFSRLFLCLALRQDLRQWKDYARCLEVLCEETELHLIDQVQQAATVGR